MPFDRLSVEVAADVVSASWRSASGWGSFSSRPRVDESPGLPAVAFLASEDDPTAVDELALAAGETGPAASELDLMALENALGEEVGLARVRVLAIFNDSADHALSWGSAGTPSEAWSTPLGGDDDARVVIGPRGGLVLFDAGPEGYPCGPGDRLLRLDGQGESVPWRVFLAGSKT